MMSSLTVATLKEISSLKRQPFISSQYTHTHHNKHTNTLGETHTHIETQKTHTDTHSIVELFDCSSPHSPFVITLSNTEGGGYWSHSVCVFVCACM